MGLMQYNVRDVYRTGPCFRKFLLELKEPSFNFIFNIIVQLPFSAHKLWLNIVVIS